ncbi:unnamed protein product [Moneuplotes crassus]|uniref:C2H2-type domain-containing protein n=1 Tax=Euplotes crassus TaxID=5936 RepID=A0AAD1XJB0_EUPCR|nr:unnamed protein product [Moneuplotes crassus]
MHEDVPIQQIGIIPQSQQYLNIQTALAYVCKFCGQPFSSQNVLERHLSKHSQDRPWECQQCDKKFKRKDHLTRHYSCVHGGDAARKYKCPYPGCTSPGYVESYHLARHIESVHEKLECNMCLSTFTKKNALEAHLVEDHGVDPPFICIVCNAYFFREKVFEMHIKKHETSKPAKPKNVIGGQHKLSERNLNIKTEFPSDLSPNAPFKILKGEVPTSQFPPPEEDGITAYNKGLKPAGPYKKDYLEDFSILTKPTIEDKNYNSTCIDPILMGQGPKGEEFMNGYYQNIQGFETYDKTSFGFPRFTYDGDKFNIPTTSLFKELCIAETFGPGPKNQVEDEDSETNCDVTQAFLNSAILE